MKFVEIIALNLFEKDRDIYMRILGEFGYNFEETGSSLILRFDYHHPDGNLENQSEITMSRPFLYLRTNL